MGTIINQKTAAVMKTLRDTSIEHPFFLGLKPDQLKILLGCASEAKFQADQVLFREGEPASRFYLVGSGRVAIEPEFRSRVRVRSAAVPSRRL